MIEAFYLCSEKFWLNWGKALCGWSNLEKSEQIFNLISKENIIKKLNKFLLVA